MSARRTPPRSAAGHVGPARVAASQVAPARFAAVRFADWRELICEAFLDLTPESDLREDFTGRVTQWPLGRLNLARIDASRQVVRRTPRDITRAPRHGYYANLQLRGSSRMTQAGRETVLRPGDLAVVETEHPFEFTFRERFSQLSLFIPAALLPGAVPTATRISTVSGVGAAVRHALTTLSQTTPAHAVRLATTTAELLAIALDQPPPVRPARSPRTYEAAVEDIAEHLTDDDLSPATTARRLGVSVRWLHGVFAGRERTFTATVRHLRLERARRDLQDPARAHLRVIDIAAEAGFPDVTSFHRAFRRHYGQTPTQSRHP